MSTIDAKTLSSREASNNWALGVWAMGRAAEEILRHSAYLELRNVSCDFHEGVLTLRGKVHSYHLKQMAQTLLCEFEGVLELNNQLDVVAPIDLRQSNCRSVNLDPPPRRYV